MDEGGRVIEEGGALMNGVISVEGLN